MNTRKVDVHALPDHRNIPINKVGINNLAYTGHVNLLTSSVWLMGIMECLVSLSPDKKGTHMSRMVCNLNNLCDKELTPELLHSITLQAKTSLECTSIYISIFTEGVRVKAAPVSQLSARESFKINFHSVVDTDEKGEIDCEIDIIGTSLCPASKLNSKYGAHSQRARVRVLFPYTDETYSQLNRYFSAIEASLSAPVYPILKMRDEVYVTEQAFENAKFVEDIVRDLYSSFEELDLAIKSLSCENYESIHTHNAYAFITK